MAVAPPSKSISHCALPLMEFARVPKTPPRPRRCRPPCSLLCVFPNICQWPFEPIAGRQQAHSYVAAVRGVPARPKPAQASRTLPLSAHRPLPARNLPPSATPAPPDLPLNPQFSILNLPRRLHSALRIPHSAFRNPQSPILRHPRPSAKSAPNLPLAVFHSLFAIRHSSIVNPQSSIPNLQSPTRSSPHSAEKNRGF